MKILIIKQSALGDVLHVTAHLSAIHRLFPEAYIVVVCSRACAPILRHHPAVDELLEFDRKLFDTSRLAAFGDLFRLLKRVRQHKFDLACDLQGRARSAVFLYAARSSRKFIKGRFPFLRGFHDRSLHAIDEMTAVLRLADLDIGDDLAMTFHTEQPAREKIDAWLTERSVDRFIVLSPYSTHSAKDWALDGFKNLITQLLSTAELSDCHIFVTGTADRNMILERMVETVADSRVHCLAGQLDLNGFAALIERASLVVTGDSFPMHLSAAVATPLLAIFGPTRESQVGPRGTGPTRIVRAASCDGCTRPRLCKRRCLSDMSADRVYPVALELLNATASGPFIDRSDSQIETP